MHNIAELFILGLDYGYCTNLLSNLGIHQGIGRQKTSHSASFNWEWEVLYFVSRKTWVFVFIDDWRWLAAIELNHKIWRSKQQLLLYHCAGYSKLRGGLSIGKRVGEGSKGRSDALWLIEGSLEVKLPTIWRDEKAVSREKSQKRKDQKKEDAGARKGRKVAKHCVFSWFCGSGGLKSRLAKAAGAETSGEMRDEKLHAVVARSTFRSQNVQNTPFSDHFWKLRCWKSARRCGAKHISKSKCTKHLSVGPLLEVEMSKKCTPLWREAHFEVKMYKTHHSRTTFGSWDVEKVHAVVARSTFRSQNVQSTSVSDDFWKLRCRKSARRCGAKHIWKSKC